MNAAESMEKSEKQILRRVVRLFHTIKYLRWEQIVFRIWRRLYRPTIDRSISPARRPPSGHWVPPVVKPVHLRQPWQFEFLHVRRDCSFPEDWNTQAMEKLWLYNLHYFDDLQSRNFDERKAMLTTLLRQWIEDNPPGFGNGWEPYPVSLRIVNWVKWVLAGNECSASMMQNLAIQAQYLYNRLEYHLLGNHLFANGKALIFAGLFFDGPEADNWLLKGQEIIEQELAEQILTDDGHFERSPMYHAIILEDVLDMINVMTAYAMPVPGAWRDCARKMVAWLAHMTHPNGEFSFFNDSALAIAPTLSELTAYGRQLGVVPALVPAARLIALNESGYIRVAERETVALLDVAPIGPDYLPGHAHADTLSFELSLFGRRVVVNSGTSCYGSSAERARQRGTAAHSTVEVGGMDSSEVWGGFRVARRALPFGLTIEESESGVTIRCAHNGYRRLPGKPVHRRQWSFAQGSLEVCDWVEGGSSAITRFYLHPDVQVQGGGRKGVLLLPDNHQIRWRANDGDARLVESTYHPEFGVSIPNRCLELPLLEGKATMTFSWE